jgi:hypothetical protein
MSRCRENAGVLFKHPCKEPMVAQCTRCNKPICERHKKGKPGEPTCVDCLRQELRDRGHRGSYAYLHDDPYFYWYYSDHRWYDDPYYSDDYDLFDASRHDAYADDMDNNWEGS